MNFVWFKGNFLPDNEPLVSSQNRSLRYGDGLFETMKIYKGQILLENFHFDRLLLGLKMLQIENVFTPLHLSKIIFELCKKNNCIECARVRLTVFRNHENQADYIVEAFPLSQSINQWNEEGLTVDIYPYARKSADAFSNLKTANFLPYVLAELFAKEKDIDDAIVLNAFNFLCDSSKANIFLIKNQQIYTPALHQGCISGVMRRFVLDEFKRTDFRIHLQEISEQDLASADEVFLTNSIFDIRWVKKFRNKTYTCTQVQSIYKKIISPLY